MQTFHVHSLPKINYDQERVVACKKFIVIAQISVRRDTHEDVWLQIAMQDITPMHGINNLYELEEQNYDFTFLQTRGYPQVSSKTT